MSGSHDITHCSNSLCPKCETCYRYLMYKDALEKNIEYISMLVIEPGKFYEPCEIYWEVKDGK